MRLAHAPASACATCSLTMRPPQTHFGKFAQHYAAGAYFFDLHPPLGKLIFAAVLGCAAGARRGAPCPPWLTPRSPPPPPSAGSADAAACNFGAIGSPFGEGCEYARLRLVSALCGAAAPLLAYATVRAMRHTRVAAGLAAAFALLDTAAVVQSRLVMLDAVRCPRRALARRGLRHCVGRSCSGSPSSAQRCRS